MYAPQKVVVVTASVATTDALLVVLHAFPPMAVLGVVSALLHPEEVMVTLAAIGGEIASLQPCLCKDYFSVWYALAVEFLPHLLDSLPCR